MTVYRLVVIGKRGYKTMLDEVYASREVAQAWAEHFTTNGHKWQDVFEIEEQEVCSNNPPAYMD